MKVDHYNFLGLFKHYKCTQNQNQCIFQAETYLWTRPHHLQKKKMYPLFDLRQKKNRLSNHLLKEWNLKFWNSRDVVRSGKTCRTNLRWQTDNIWNKTESFGLHLVKLSCLRTREKRLLKSLKDIIEFALSRFWYLHRTIVWRSYTVCNQYATEKLRKIFL